MGKNPAFQFYPSDWTRDMDDQDLEIEGAWIRIICRLWWSEKRGEATKTLKEWARILRKTDKKTMKIFQILFEKHIASGSLLDNQNITIISRRIVRDNEISQIRRASGVLGGNPKLIKTSNILDNQTVNQKPTPSSSSSSSTSNINNNKQKIIFKENHFINIPELLISKWKQVAPGIKIQEEIKKAELWVISNPDKHRSQWTRFLSNWMVKAQENYIKYGGNNGTTKTYRTGNGNSERTVGIPPIFEGSEKPTDQDVERNLAKVRQLSKQIAGS